MSLMSSDSVQQSTSEEHTIMLESADGAQVAELRRRYKRVQWDFYLYSCDYLELEYDRRWYWPIIKKTMKSSSSDVMGWPLVRLVFYLPQPDIDVTYDGKVEQLVESPDKIEVFPLVGKMPSPYSPLIDSLEKLARLAFPATKQEQKEADRHRRAVKKAVGQHRGSRAPAKKAAAKKAPAKKSAVKKAPAKKAVRR
jgi:hypothetical protein